MPEQQQVTGPFETPLELASRQVAEAEQRQARQTDLIAGLTGGEEVLAHAQQLLAEITRTLTIAQAHRSLLFSLDKDE
ncbi:hypothetical protein [Methylobacterium oxalidis]|uniref:Uncharacterized protein n=1 Tax=Methylobacterium oxalidis TaxID=944322 RepID=A0A512JBF0_9HYPH|nr:hypothetical protein [Methylobacterium oxalidis]GEP07292.1 hypothetical protein MOX02_53300 [Methylobacterium oxalidis]GJE31427.1 hypothetical protein LDDCCGHA_1605 [Methylobacterium oxalidis]GLS65136.1 hypothetical protein GCM10007888_35180 [Methylobacterium oxalidis]